MTQKNPNLPNWFCETRGMREAARHCKTHFQAVGSIWLHNQEYYDKSLGYSYARMIWCLRISECPKTGFRFFEDREAAEGWRVLRNIDAPGKSTRIHGNKAELLIMDELADAYSTQGDPKTCSPTKSQKLNRRKSLKFL